MGGLPPGGSWGAGAACCTAPMPGSFHWLATTQPLLPPLPPRPHQCLCPPPPTPQAKHPGVTVASFDTTADELENLTAELGVKGLPQFRFYKVCLGLGALSRRLGRVARGAMLWRPYMHRLWPSAPAFLLTHAAACAPQDGAEALDKIMGYKLAPLTEAFKKLDGL